ncbi:hypothetical protein [Ekhidna sp.]|uniref:GHMP family kinase ATP-binding protein n=1 Tax=Ekhidna sp. TaxID=2608089 RepID=UPI003296B31F
MIITRTPFRISFVGGGSDLPAFYKQHGGAVLSTTINKYMYISSHKYFEADKIRVKYSKTETVNSIDDLQHPIFREALKKFQINGGIEFSSIADVPAGTGMGSSSSFTVGLLQNIYATKNQLISKEKLADEACQMEIDILKEPIGKQDQYAAAYGGLNVMKFHSDDTVTVENLYINTEEKRKLEENLVLFYTGQQRKANKILAEQTAHSQRPDKVKVLREMTQLVDELKNALLKNDFEDFGKLLNINWELKKSLTDKITNREINEAYELALKHGAWGGKLLGAGGGGFLLFMCPKEKQSELSQALGLRSFDFKFDEEGSKVIYFADE